VRARVRSTRAIAATAASALLAGLAPPAAAAASYPETVAKRVEREVVYVERGVEPPVSDAGAGRIRLRILDKDLGRIKIAVVTAGHAEENGGATGLAHAITHNLDLRGTLLVVAGREAYALTSHPESAATVEVLDRAFRKHNDRTRQLLAAVDGIAAVDPGPKGDPQNPVPGSPIPNFPDVDDDVNGIFDAFRIGALITAIATALPFVVLAIWLALRFRRSRKEAEEIEEDRQVDIRDQLIKLGDEIRALDLDAQMPGVTASSLSDYEAAIEQYDRANATLERPDLTAHRVEEAGAAVAEGMRRIEAAKVRLGRSPASPGTPASPGG
jgi:hypothetical protein